MRASAKGVLMMPEDCLPDGVSIDDIAESWTEFNGVIVYKPSKSGKVPEQVANNSTNIGIAELLNMQLKFFEDISGVTGALQGKPGYSGESASHYNQQTENATKSLLDLLECFSCFVVDGAYKDVKNMQQFYDSKRVFNIAGKSGAQIEYDPKKIRDVEFDLSIDTKIVSLTKADIEQAVQNFYNMYKKVYVDKFIKTTAEKNTIYLGGGCGYGTKTVIYNLLGEERGTKVIARFMSKKFSEHHYNKDVKAGVSPHMLKCTNYCGNIVEMGKCRIEISEES